MRLVGSAAAAGVVIELKESGSTEFGRKELAAGSTTAADVSAKVSRVHVELSELRGDVTVICRSQNGTGVKTKGGGWLWRWLPQGAQCVLRPGDMIVGVNEQEVESVKQLSVLLQIRTDRWRLAIERGGKVFDLTVRG